MLPKESLHLHLGCHFCKINVHTAILRSFTHFVRIFSHFARILRDFSRIFTKSKHLGVRLHPRLLD